MAKAHLPAMVRMPIDILWKQLEPQGCCHSVRPTDGGGGLPRVSSPVLQRHAIQIHTHVQRLNIMHTRNKQD